MVHLHKGILLRCFLNTTERLWHHIAAEGPCAIIPGLTILAIIQAYIQYFELVHPNIYFIYKLLMCMEEPVLQSRYFYLIGLLLYLPATPQHGTAAAALSLSCPDGRQREHRTLALYAGYKHKS